MTRDMAKAMCQHFMDARLIENAADRSSNLFKDRGVFVLTPKGLHVLERFITKNGISADPLAKVFSSQPICLKLLHLERRSSDDEIIISQSVVTALFRRFAGRTENYMAEPSNPPDLAQEYHERSKGIPLMDVVERTPAIIGRSNPMGHKFCFEAVTALQWLCDFTSIVGRDEAAEMAAHFVRFGLIVLVSDKRKGNDSAIIFTVRGNTPGGNSTVTVSGHQLPLIYEHPSNHANDRSIKANLDALPRLSTKSPTKVGLLLDGTIHQDGVPLVPTRQTPLQPIFRRPNARRWTTPSLV